MVPVDRLPRPTAADWTAAARGPDRAIDARDRGPRLRASERPNDGPLANAVSNNDIRANSNRGPSDELFDPRARAAAAPKRDALARFEPQSTWRAPPAADDLRTRMAAENKQAAGQATERAAQRAVREYGES